MLNSHRSSMQLVSRRKPGPLGLPGVATAGVIGVAAPRPAACCCGGAVPVAGAQSLRRTDRAGRRVRRRWAAVCQRLCAGANTHDGTVLPARVGGRRCEAGAERARGPRCTSRVTGAVPTPADAQHWRTVRPLAAAGHLIFSVPGMPRSPARTCSRLQSPKKTRRAGTVTEDD